METPILKPIRLGSKQFNRVAYCFLVGLAFVCLFFQEWSTAFILMGTSLALDPFNPAQAWKLRPTWQKAWLGVHLTMEMALLLVTIFIKN